MDGIELNLNYIVNIFQMYEQTSDAEIKERLKTILMSKLDNAINEKVGE